MNLSEPFIHRPVATTLLGFAVLLAGVMGGNITVASTVGKGSSFRVNVLLSEVRNPTHIAPIEAPMAMPPSTKTQATASAGGCEPSVVSTAIAMPIMPKRLPRRLDSGFDSPRSAWMKRTPATR